MRERRAERLAALERMRAPPDAGAILNDSPTTKGSDTMRHVRWIGVALVAAACGGSIPTPAQESAVRDEGRDQAACVAQNETRETIDACRARVRASYGRAPR